MNFEHEGDAPEMVAFRAEVRAWIQANSKGVGAPSDARDLTTDQVERNRAFLGKLGAKGWNLPTFPKAYGGGGLSPAHADIINEELHHNLQHVESVHLPGDIGIAMARSTMVYGTEEHKKRWVSIVGKGDSLIWELYTEPEAGSDLPSLKTTAVKDGGDYVISGVKTFVGGYFAPDWMHVLAITNPDRGRHKNLSMIMAPGNSPGIKMDTIDMTAGSGKRTVYLDNVRVPQTNIIGKEGDGWPIFAGPYPGAPYIGSHFQLEANMYFDDVVRYCKTHKRNGKPLLEDPQVRDLLAQLYIDCRRMEALKTRDTWMAKNRVRMTYQFRQATMFSKLFDVHASQVMLQAMGPVAVIKDPGLAPRDGDLEYYHRYALLMLHPGGTVEVQKLRVFRGMLESYPAS